jgi:hypothetical protein
MFEKIEGAIKNGQFIDILGHKTQSEQNKTQYKKSQ